MFAVNEDDVVAIRSAFDAGGELAAAVELRRRFAAIQDNAQARECVRMIVRWQPPAPRADPAPSA